MSGQVHPGVYQTWTRAAFCIEVLDDASDRYAASSESAQKTVKYDKRKYKRPNRIQIMFGDSRTGICHPL